VKTARVAKTARAMAMEAYCEEVEVTLRLYLLVPQQLQSHRCSLVSLASPGAVGGEESAGGCAGGIVQARMVKMGRSLSWVVVAAVAYLLQQRCPAHVGSVSTWG
jgi:hypothetical protein